MMFGILSETAVPAGGRALPHLMDLPHMSLDGQGALDLVTVPDREAERFIQDRMRETFPDNGVFGTEGAFTRGTSGRAGA